MLTVKHILHPTDFSKSSEAAFQLACSLARDYGARVLVAHVVVPPTIVYAEGVVPPEPENSLEAAGEQLGRVESRDPGIPVSHRLLQGDVADQIVRLAGEVVTDVIVMGTHGRTGLGRVLMGSVAERVTRRAPCPVLTVRVPDVAASSGSSRTQPAAVAGPHA